MATILFLAEAIYCKILRCIYRRNEKHFANYFFPFLNLHLILNIFEKMIALLAEIFLHLRYPKNVVR